MKSLILPLLMLLNLISFGQPELNIDTEDVKVEIHVDSAAYYKGKSINLFIKIINNSNKPISHSEISLNLFNAETNKKP
jgi:hypothetical protein